MPLPTPPSPEPAREARRGLRLAWLALGSVLLGLGLIGAFVPLMPTTVFLILAAACFTRSSPRLEHWLLNHPRFGPGLRSWRAQGAIPHVGKIAACTGMAVGYAVFLLAGRPASWLAALVALGLAACAGWIVSRPKPS